MHAAILRICCKHRVPRNVNVNKVDIFYGIVLNVVPFDVHFHYTFMCAA